MITIKQATMSKRKMVTVKRTDGMGNKLMRSGVRETMKNLFRMYIASDAWRTLRDDIVQRDKVCQKCGEPYKPGMGFSAHHNSYEHWGKANYEEKEDLELLCRGCHSHADHSHVPFWAKRSTDPYYYKDIPTAPAIDIDFNI